MKNLDHCGKVMPVTAPYDLNSGDLFVVGILIGVAATAAANGSPVQQVNGGQVFNTLPKATGETWAVGDVLYWDATNKKLTKTASGNTKAAAASAAAQSADTIGSAKLLPNL